MRLIGPSRLVRSPSLPLSPQRYVVVPEPQPAYHDVEGFGARQGGSSDQRLARLLPPLGYPSLRSPTLARRWVRLTALALAVGCQAPPPTGPSTGLLPAGPTAAIA